MFEKSINSWSPLPLHLVSRPQRHTEEVLRSVVIEHLDDAIHRCRVTRIVAPSGYGKTSALRQWADRADLPVAWLTLTEFDNDPMRLYRGFVSALKHLARTSDGDFGQPLLQLIPDVSSLSAGYEGLASALDRTVGSVAIVVDDAHLGGDALRETVVRILGMGAPTALRLVLAGSTEIDLPARFGLDGTLADIPPAMFAFTAEEMLDLTKTLGIGNDASLTHRVLERTAGWPVAVRAILFDANGGEAVNCRSGSNLIADLVAEEVLPRLGQDLADFVLAATICPRLDEDIARRLTGRPDSAALLELCVQRGLFIDRYHDDDGTPNYRWHAVIAEACQAIFAEQNPDELERLQREAADALRDDHPLSAMDHALRAGDPELAVEIISSTWAGVLLRSGAPALDQACRALPRPWSAAPEVLYARSCCLDITGDRLGASLLAQRAGAATADIEPTRQERVSLVAASAALLLADDHEVLLAAVDDLTNLLSKVKDLPPRSYAHLLFLTGWAELRLRRSPELAIQLLESARREAIAVGEGDLARRAGANSAFALAFAGLFRSAEEQLDRTRADLDDQADWNAYDGGIEATARGYIAFHRGEAENATRHLRSVAEGDLGNGPYALMAVFHLALIAADTAAPIHLDEAEQSLWRLPVEPHHGMPWPQYKVFAQCRIALAHGDSDKALELARTIRDLRFVPVMGSMLAEVHRQIGTIDEAGDCLNALDGLPMPTYGMVGAF
ncbi:MAG TPA: AAA family ATPase, partial [Microthrixaceae bacterium]|nr:AAA family ATPase [Microthrixaceae bacterium]